MVYCLNIISNAPQKLRVLLSLYVRLMPIITGKAFSLMLNSTTHSEYSTSYSVILSSDLQSKANAPFTAKVHLCLHSVE